MVRIPREQANHIKMLALSQDRRYSEILGEAIDVYLQLVARGWKPGNSLEEVTK